MAKTKVTLLSGDGIGPEITRAVVEVFRAAAVPVEWIDVPPAKDPVQIVEYTLKSFQETGVVLKGPITTPIGKGHRSINVAIRQAFDLFVNVRPVRSLPGVETPWKGIDLILFRENLEDTYSGIEYMPTPNVAQGLKIATRGATERCIRFAYEYAKREGRKRMTCVQKANIHKKTDGLFLEVFEEIAGEFTEFESGGQLVDNVAMQLVKNPGQYDSMVTMNLYGDILSDLAAGLVGGLGLVPSANIGPKGGVFEAVHGSAPDIAGKKLANPTALLLSGLMMLRYLGFGGYSERIYAALISTLESGCKTRDIGGSSSTDEFTTVLCSKLREKTSLSDAAGTEATRFDAPPLEIFPTAPFLAPLGVEFLIPTAQVQMMPNDLEEISKREVLELQSDVAFVRYFGRERLDEKFISDLFQRLNSAGISWIECRKLYSS